MQLRASREMLFTVYCVNQGARLTGDLTWFLSICIVRDRALHKTWLVQDAFIDKVCARFSIEAVGKAPDVLLIENWLPQSIKKPDAARIKLY
jgi:hypothetical protein